MTLFNKLLVVILISFSANLVGVLWLEFANTRHYLVNQLESDLNNTSTSLSMALAEPLEMEDEVLVQSTIKTYFDGGFYEVIAVRMLNQDKLIKEQVPVKVSGVPDWFVALDLIKVPSVNNTITSGWLQTGELTIKGHPGFAYQQLWRAFVDMSSWLALLSSILILLAITGIRRLLKPLEAIKEKAQAVQERKFGEPLPIPDTLEFATVTEAINKMTAKLQEQFSEEARLHNKLKEQAFQDATTGFGNRAFFNRQLLAWLEEQTEGLVIFIEVLGLDEINHKQGWLARDEAVKQIAHHLENELAEHTGSVKCRLSAHEFALIVSNIDKEQGQALVSKLTLQLHTTSLKECFGQQRICNIGAVYITEKSDNSSVLALADHAMQLARQETTQFKLIEQSNESRHNFARLDIKDAVEKAIDSSSLAFSRQPVSLIDSGSTLHFEAFAKLKLDNLEQVHAGAFISVLDEFELGTLFDRKVIELLIDYLQHNQEQVYAINLTASALKNLEFIDWLVAKLESNQGIAPYIGFEFSEESVIYNLEHIEYLCRRLTDMNIHFGVDRVGRNFSSLAYLQSIHPQYVKIDHAYTQMAMNSENDAYFVGSLCTTIHNLDIKVIATRVETEEQLGLLKDYHFDAYQGFIARPESFSLKN
ncbi:EAL domain-containing protein [Catenovulum sp. SM1970]|uniref:bifunctional diguanylate cyclase/phosphodiesterase n=1 Tax=Marinifaba aquimaris TaxID=2741323 RepID=UPI001574A701|nr:EAL domain-containing protein [Marinifaba aquimaris]NTS75627.1 EAL domain-containing protein [Marinifaba aquimaris]